MCKKLFLQDLLSWEIPCTVMICQNLGWYKYCKSVLINHSGNIKHKHSYKIYFRQSPVVLKIHTVTTHVRKELAGKQPALEPGLKQGERAERGASVGRQAAGWAQSCQ